MDHDDESEILMCARAGQIEGVGNVFEHCKDSYGPYTRAVADGNGERIGWSNNRLLRGGAFDVTHPTARVSTRSPAVPTFNGFNVGVRPARSVD